MICYYTWPSAVLFNINNGLKIQDVQLSAGVVIKL